MKCSVILKRFRKINSFQTLTGLSMVILKKKLKCEGTLRGVCVDLFVHIQQTDTHTHTYTYAHTHTKQN